MLKLIAWLIVFNILYLGSSRAQNKDDSFLAIYDTCLYRHVGYWMSRSDKSGWPDSVFIVTKNKDYKGSEEVKVSGTEIKYLTESEIYELASKKPVGIIKFSPPLITDSSIVISVIDFSVIKKKRHFYDFANHGGSGHTISYNCQTGKFEVVSSKEGRP